MRVQAKTTTEQEEADLEAELNIPPEGLETLDAKVSSAVDGIATGSIAADLAVLTDRHLEDTGLPISGRRKLRVVYNAFRTSARRGGLYSLADIQAVKLHGDDLETFLRNWENTIQGLSEPQPEKNLQDLLAGELRKSKTMSLEMQMYDREESLGGPCFTYKFLFGSAKSCCRTGSRT